MKYALRKITLAALASLASLGVAHAGGGDDDLGFHGYMRAGAGGSSASGPQACYALQGGGTRFRLGNECDSYFEGGYTATFAKADDGVQFDGTLWLNDWSPTSSFGNGSLGLAKAYVEAKNISFLQGGTAWVGERYYYRPDIHMLDLQYINMNGTGGGIDRIKVGSGNFSYAFFKDNDGTQVTSNGVITTTAAVRQNLIYRDLPVNEGGKLDVALTAILAQQAGNHNGYNVNLFHNQALAFGSNTFGVQYGVGAGTGLGGSATCCNRIGASGSTALDSSTTITRVFDNLVIQPTKAFSMQFVALTQTTKNPTGDNTGSSTLDIIGARPVYVVAPHFKLQAEIGTESVSNTGQATQRLNKITIAPTLAVNDDYWSRPELRLFVTYGNWNKAASAAVNANATNNSTTTPVFGTATQGLSAGLQVEAWW